MAIFIYIALRYSTYQCRLGHGSMLLFSGGGIGSAAEVAHLSDISDHEVAAVASVT